MTGITDPELSAYLDGTLDARRAAEIRQALAEDPALARRLDSFAEIHRLKESLFAPQDAHAEPTRLTGTSLMPWRPRLPRALPVWVALSAGIVLALFAALLSVASKGDPLIAEALQATRTALPPPSQAQASLPHIGGMSLHAPDLTSYGLILTGLRTDPTRQTASLRYTGTDGTQVTLRLRPAAGEVRFAMTQRGALRICIWQDGTLTLALAAPRPQGEIMQLVAASVAELRAYPAEAARK